MTGTVSLPSGATTRPWRRIIVEAAVEDEGKRAQAGGPRLFDLPGRYFTSIGSSANFETTDADRRLRVVLNCPPDVLYKNPHLPPLEFVGVIDFHFSGHDGLERTGNLLFRADRLFQDHVNLGDVVVPRIALDDEDLPPLPEGRDATQVLSYEVITFSEPDGAPVNLSSHALSLYQEQCNALGEFRNCREASRALESEERNSLDDRTLALVPELLRSREAIVLTSHQLLMEGPKLLAPAKVVFDQTVHLRLLVCDSRQEVDEIGTKIATCLNDSADPGNDEDEWDTYEAALLERVRELNGVVGSSVLMGHRRGVVERVHDALSRW